jgi:hypothetical protein
MHGTGKMRAEEVVEYCKLLPTPPRRTEENYKELKIGGITAGIRKGG